MDSQVRVRGARFEHRCWSPRFSAFFCPLCIAAHATVQIGAPPTGYRIAPIGLEQNRVSPDKLSRDERRRRNVSLFYAHDENVFFRLVFIRRTRRGPLASQRGPCAAAFPCGRNGLLRADNVFVPLRSSDPIEVGLRNHNVPRFALL
ncbi:hypothetical protein LJ656_33000 [Paraburkholderia sp. MMS20-SJTR3]|uniref:Secreted protein n=1 Tax=Paraburkholderia sejongensis TaxID=2886946 RepID=A0ABS8K5E3_9BURK|nr:hypothetical protein [Paraburkholderia sp. MMS20-SJTR3]MCC8397382.1 hypothetical protein [Paraburkholderia sp. MMS20-SJTR3]